MDSASLTTAPRVQGLEIEMLNTAQDAADLQVIARHIAGMTARPALTIYKRAVDGTVRFASAEDRAVNAAAITAWDDAAARAFGAIYAELGEEVITSRDDQVRWINARVRGDFLA